MISRLLITVPVLLAALQANAGVGEGQELYDAYCSVCHGGLGEGQTMGKPLTDSQANRLSDQELLDVIHNGRPGTGMAAWGDSFSDTEIFDIATYVRVLQGKPGLNLGSGDSGPSDDPMVIAGEVLFNGKADCVSCHTYGEKGGNVGPSLDGLSARLSEAEIERALTSPSADIAAGYGAKVVEQNDGSTVRGRSRNESDLAIQIQSEDGNRWITYFKERVKSITDARESLMPDTYTTLSAEEQEQLMAFLKTL